MLGCVYVVFSFASVQVQLLQASKMTRHDVNMRSCMADSTLLHYKQLWEIRNLKAAVIGSEDGGNNL